MIAVPMALPRPSMRTFRRLAMASAVALYVVVLTGAAVRLTDSGLGCSGWPNCGPGTLTPPMSFHPLVEFSNRMFTIVLGLLIGVVTTAAMRLRPRRRDLVRLSWWLVAGYLAQAVIGGVAVLLKLTPVFVMLHFLVSMLLLWGGIVLVHRADERWPSGRVVVMRTEVVWLGRLLAITAGWVLFMGTVVTGTGPDSGAPNAAARLPFPFLRVAQLHADSALFFTGLIVATLFALRIAAAPSPVWRRARWLIGLVVVQIALGYWQYFMGLPPGVVEAHIAGAAAIWVATIALNLAMVVPAEAAEAIPIERPAGADAAVTPAHPGTPSQPLVTS